MNQPFVLLARQRFHMIEHCSLEDAGKSTLTRCPRSVRAYIPCWQCPHHLRSRLTRNLDPIDVSNARHLFDPFFLEFFLGFPRFTIVVLVDGRGSCLRRG